MLESTCSYSLSCIDDSIAWLLSTLHRTHGQTGASERDHITVKEHSHIQGSQLQIPEKTKYISSSTLLWNSHFYLWVLLKNALSIQPTPVSKPEHPPEGQVSERSQASGRESNLSDQVLRIARLENYKQAPEWINRNVID